MNFFQRAFLKTTKMSLTNNKKSVPLSHKDRCPIPSSPLTVRLIGQNHYTKRYQQLLAQQPQVTWVDTPDPIDLSDEAQAAIVMVPPERRTRLIQQLLATDHHVLVDSPIADTYEAFDELLYCANQYDKRLTLTHFHSFLKTTQQARKHIFEHTLGRLKTIRIEINPQPTDPDPLLMQTQTSYLGETLTLLNLTRWLCAKNFFSLTAQVDPNATFHRPTQTMDLKINLGDAISLTCTPLPTLPYHWRITVQGYRGFLQLAANGHGLYCTSKNKREAFTLTSTQAEYDTAIADALTAFITTCRTGKEPQANALDGMVDIALITAAVQSAQNGKTVTLIK